MSNDIPIFGSQETADLIRSINWNTSSLGPIKNWPSLLISSLNTLLNTRNPVFLFWGNEHLCFYNDGYIPILGAGKHPEVMGRPAQKVWPEIWEQYTYPELKKAFSGNATWNVDQFIPVFRDGKISEAFFTYGYSPVYETDGSISGVIVYANETSGKIFAQKKMETALAINEIQKRSFELALKDAPLSETLTLLTGLVEAQTGEKSYASVLLVDETGKKLVTGAAPSLPHEYNLAVDGITIAEGAGSCGTAAFRRAPVVTVDVLQDELWKDFRDFVKQFRFRACWSTPILSPKGTLLGTFAIYHDEHYTPTEVDKEIVRIATQTSALIIDRHRSSQRRAQSEAQLRLALAGAEMGTWSIIFPEYIVHGDSKFHELHASPGSINVEEGISERHPPEDQELIRKRLETAILKKIPYECEYRVHLKNGGYRWIYARGEPTLDPKTGEVKSIDGVAFDISEIKRSEDELTKSVLVRDEFLSIASHELKTPLTSLKLEGQIQLRLAEKNKSPDNTKVFTKILRLVTRLDRLVEDMLDISRIQTGKLTIRKALTDIPQTILELIERTPMENQITFEGPGQLEARVDVMRFEQVLTNLFQNARKYAPGSPVTVKLIDLGAEFVVQVKDFGPGISPEDQKKIFERFGRAVSVMEVSGFGLGLYICQQIVQAHGGDIQVQSERGSGATFEFTLPTM